MILCWLVAGALVAGQVRAADTLADGWADVVLGEMRRGGPLPVLSDYDDALDVDTAYAIQRRVVAAALGPRRIGGYQVLLTTAAARRRFGVEVPISGVLFADGKRAGGAEIPIARGATMRLGLALGFVLRSPVTRRMRSVDDLRTYLLSAVPVAVLLDWTFDHPRGVRGVDLLAANLGTVAYVTGEPFPWEELDRLGALTVTLDRDGRHVEAGRDPASRSDPLATLLWLVDELLRRGWLLRPGQLLVTGPIGALVPVRPGTYRVGYGADRALSFRISTAPVAHPPDVRSSWTRRPPSRQAR